MDTSFLFSRSHRFLATLCLFGALSTVLSDALQAQSSVRSGSLRPFVTGLIPVIGRGGFVGGVIVDAKGVVSRSEADEIGRLREARLRAFEAIPAELGQSSTLRKVSLRGVVEAIEQKRRTGEPINDELRYLAGLQRVQYVFADPDAKDIVIAGFAEGWRITDQGNIVGQTTGQPVLHLEDLLVALRTSESALTGEGISCSIDPTPEGERRLQQFLSTRNLSMNDATLSRMEQLLGDQAVRVTGVPPTSRFARVLVAADFLLKRLGMNFEPAPIDGLPSYLEMLKADTGAAPHNAMPRFWLGPQYEPLLRDDERLSWELRGSGVRAFAEDGVLAGGSAVRGRGAKASLAAEWAERFTEKYEPLSNAMPVFGELRNCMDLAVVAALFTKEDLPRRIGLDLFPLLDDRQVQIGVYAVPRTVRSQASVLPKDRQWIVSVSGGVQVDSWPVLNDSRVDGRLASIRNQVTTSRINRWWWD